MRWPPRFAAHDGRPDVPQGRIAVDPKDGLTTRQRRNRPLLAVHTG